MTWAGFQLSVVLGACLVACGGSKGASTAQPKPGASVTDEECARPSTSAVEHRESPFAEYCKTTSSDPTLEKRMGETLASAGADARHVRLSCRADVCKVKCQTSPFDKCVAELHAVAQWSASKDLFYAIGHQDSRGVALFKFLSKASLESLPARRSILDRIARRLHDSPALASCQQNATVHGVVLLYVEVPVGGSPSVRVDGEVAMTPDADCVSKALLAAVIDENVTPPLTNRDLPIAVQL